ncbi:hypothetical protein ACFOHT_05730 [Massilia oculi]|nr:MULTISPECIES: hypothetical protein [Massilia]MDY0977301.1 hypothetical protein [Massilia sp. CFBP9012]
MTKPLMFSCQMQRFASNPIIKENHMLGLISAGISGISALSSLGGSTASNASDRAATDANNNTQDTKNLNTLNTRNSQQDEADSIADQSMENGINGMKVKMAEAQIRRSNDTVQAAGSIG